MRSHIFAATFFALALLFSSHAFSQSETCRYDDTSGTFHIDGDRSIKIFFGSHGSSVLISEYVNRGEGNKASGVRKLIAGHSDQLPIMRANLKLIRSSIASKKVNWVGFENSQAGIEEMNGYSGIVNFLQQQDLRVQKLGLSESERRDYLMIISDPMMVAYYLERGREGTVPKKVMGFDNARSSKRDDEKMLERKMLLDYDDLRDALRAPALKMPSWVNETLDNAKVGKTFINEPRRAPDLARRVSTDSRYGSLDIRQKNAFSKYLDFVATSSPTMQRYVDEDRAEFAARDRDIATNILEQAKADGHGHVYIGELHKEGVLKYLGENCRNPATGRPRGNRGQPNSR